MKTKAELERETDEFVRKLERVELKLWEFNALLEYSTTIPTGKTPGKSWKKQVYFGKHRGSWLRGTYVDNDPDPMFLGIKWELITFSDVETQHVLDSANGVFYVVNENMFISNEMYETNIFFYTSDKELMTFD